ncbi:hypothetical protein HRW15_24785, partial [Streptomyces lunaelactis]|nr:hypothetical protein [Streptomyces lunaelactis]
MAVYQLPVETGVFARYLKGLTALLDPGDGWYAIFWQRDPDGMRACLDGAEIPPWDVVESLLQDLASTRGAEFAGPESPRARQLHTAAAAAHDRLPGGRQALEERLELMRREQVYATGRAEELVRRRLAEPGSTPEAEQLANELAWTRDDHARATARVLELRSRLAAVADGRGHVSASPAGEHARQAGGPGDEPEHAREDDDWSGFAGRYQGSAPEAPAAVPDSGDGLEERPGPAPVYGDATRRPSAVPDDWFRPDPTADSAPEAPGRPGAQASGTPPAARVVKNKKRRPRGGARFAGVEGAGEEIAAVPVLPVADDAPRGARYGGD